MNNVLKMPITKEKTIFDRIENYLAEQENPTTRKNYEIDIRDFVEYITDAKNSQLSIELLQSLDNDDIVDFKKSLIHEGYKGASINRRISTVRNFYRYLSRSVTGINPEICKVKRMKEGNGYSYVTLEEAHELIELAKSLKDGSEKSLMIELATYTSIRLKALSTLRWSNIRPQKDYWIVKVLDKGDKWDEKPITDDLYQRLLKLKGESPLVFSLSVRTFQRAVEELVDMTGMAIVNGDKENVREITFHSLKSVAIVYTLQTTGDIFKASKQGNHSNIQTTYRHYLKIKQDFEGMAGLTMGQDLDMSFLDGMNKEQIIGIIKSCSEATLREIFNKVNSQ